KARASPAEGGSRQPRQQPATDAVPARLGTDIKVFEVDRGTAEESREGVEEQREPDRLTTHAGQHDLGIRAGAKQGGAEPFFRGDDLVLEVLIAGEIADELQNQTDFVLARGPDGNVFAHMRC